jgi:hypothetical protein
LIASLSQLGEVAKREITALKREKEVLTAKLDDVQSEKEVLLLANKALNISYLKLAFPDTVSDNDPVVDSVDPSDLI